MTHPKISIFLLERDRAYVRNDIGVVRSMNAELRRLGVRDDATLEHPGGAPKNGNTKPGRPKLPRCEHGSVTDRCQECNPDLAAH